MCFSRFMATLRQHGITVPEHQVRHWLRSGQLTRPPKDLNGDYLWGDVQIAQIAALIVDPNRDRRRARKQKTVSAVA